MQYFEDDAKAHQAVEGNVKGNLFSQDLWKKPSSVFKIRGTFFVTAMVHPKIIGHEIR
jgi:hypothetical protein